MLFESTREPVKLDEKQRLASFVAAEEAYRQQRIRDIKLYILCSS